MISVVVPTWGEAPYLAETLASIHAQTYKNIELLVVKDQIGNMVKNWNRCLDLASGEWVKFVHHDDLLEPSCLERLADSRGLIVACKRDFLFANDITEANRVRFIDHVADVTIERSFSAITFAARIARNPGANQIGEPVAVMFKRRCVEKFGHFCEKLKQIADWEYFARIACNEDIDFINEPLAVFRVHKEAASAAASDLDLEAAVMLDEICTNPHYRLVHEASNFLSINLYHWRDVTAQTLERSS